MPKAHRVRGGRFARIWRRLHRADLAGVHFNPIPIDPTHPHAPKSHPLPRSHKHVKPKPAEPFGAHVVYWSHVALGFAGKMTYTEDLKLRQQLFARAIGKFLGACADCSQFVSSILHWLGVKSVTCWDATGSLWNKGRVLVHPQPGCVVIWGAFPGQHTAFATEKTPGGKDWYVVGFGHQGAPDRNTLSGMNAYFASRGHPGVRYLDISE